MGSFCRCRDSKLILCPETAHARCPETNLSAKDADRLRSRLFYGGIVEIQILRCGWSGSALLMKNWTPAAKMFRDSLANIANTSTCSSFYQQNCSEVLIEFYIIQGLNSLLQPLLILLNYKSIQRAGIQQARQIGASPAPQICQFSRSQAQPNLKTGQSLLRAVPEDGVNQMACENACRGLHNSKQWHNCSKKSRAS